MNVSIHLLKKAIEFLKSITKYMKKYTNSQAFTKENYKFCKIYNKIRISEA